MTISPVPTSNTTVGSGISWPGNLTERNIIIKHVLFVVASPCPDQFTFYLSQMSNTRCTQYGRHVRDCFVKAK